jgi:hypothetical protein
MSSPIVGTYTNSQLSAKLVITDADDSTGVIKGNFTIGSINWPITGGWNASTVAPGGVFSLTGATGNSVIVLAATGATPDFRTWPNTTIAASFAQKGGVVNQLCGQFIRS